MRPIPMAQPKQQMEETTTNPTSTLKPIDERLEYFKRNGHKLFRFIGCACYTERGDGILMAAGMAIDGGLSFGIQLGIGMQYFRAHQFVLYLNTEFPPIKFPVVTEYPPFIPFHAQIAETLDQLGQNQFDIYCWVKSGYAIDIKRRLPNG